MQKLLKSRRADRGREQDATDTSVLRLSGMLDQASRTLVCAVLFLDIVEYSKKAVAEQLKIKERFTAGIAEAIRDIPVNDRIILDTGDGVAVNFLDDPEDALFVALRLSRAFASGPQGEPLIEVCFGINLGPVRLVRDSNGQPNIIGDGINVAERVKSFAGTGQVLVSRSYYEAVTRSCEGYAQLFAYQGSRTDKHVREHEIYQVAGPSSEALDLATRRRQVRSAARPGLVDPAQGTYATSASLRPSWFAHRALAYGAATLSVATLLAAVAFHVSQRADKEAPKAARPAVIQPANVPEPPPPAIVADAPTVLSAAPEPVKPISAPPVRKQSAARKPSHAAAKAHKPSSHDAQTPARRAERRSTPELPAAKTPVAEEQAPVATASSPKAPAGPTALVMFAVSPWGEIVLDGKSVGVSPPLSELELTPGHHRIEIRNGSFKPYLETFELEPNQTVRIKYKFKER